jgi:uncharacterized protein YidB (DUF937 family)
MRYRRAMTDSDHGNDGADDTKMLGALGDLLGKGGAAGILGKLDSLGLGNLGSSWVGLGKNLPISPSQLTSVLGSGPIASIAAKLGISTEKATIRLVDLMPRAIDHMTPTGQPPAADAEAPDPTELAAKLRGG